MANVIVQLRERLRQRRPFRIDRTAKDVAYPSQVAQSLAELPADSAQQLVQLVKELPSHPCDQEAILQSLRPAIARWKDSPNATNNSLTVLSSPVSAVARILAESLEDWSTQNALVMELLDWTSRPTNPEQIQQKMRTALKRNGEETDCQQVVVIPNLNWCFLRSAEGLDGIDYLRDNLLSDFSRFWIVGSGQIAWQYLDSVLKLQAHCGEVIKLPQLSGEQLQDWLMPVIERLDIQLDEAPIQERLQELGEESSQSFLEVLKVLFEETRDSLKSLFRVVREDALASDSGAIGKDMSELEAHWEDYFERLSDLSDGVGNIALQLFVKSIYYEEAKAPPKATPPEAEQTGQKWAQDSSCDLSSRAGRLIAKMPKLPSLPKLAQSDLYILFSLLVHGDATLTALAESLGEERQLINDSLQVFRKIGLVEQQDRIFWVNPIHYPRLKRHLTSNNFIVQVSE